MKKILLAHLKQYPQMQLQDVVKLLYQSEFGGGHMITSPEKSLDRKKSTKALSGSILPLYANQSGEKCTGFICLLWRTDCPKKL